MKKIINISIIIIIILNLTNINITAINSEETTIIWNENFFGEIKQNDTIIGYADGNGYYFIERPYIIEAGITLIIEPGITIEFGGNLSRLSINGTLLAIGTEDDPITFSFKSKDLPDDIHNWPIIDFHFSSGSIFRYCYFNNTWTSIWSGASEIMIENCFFSNTYDRCIESVASTLIIRNNTFTNNHEALFLITLHEDYSTIQNNIMSNNFVVASIFLLQPKETYITENKIINTTNGFEIAEMKEIEREFVIKNNYIDCSGSTIRYVNEVFNRTLIVEYNYWGSIDKSEIENQMEGNIDFEPWLDENGDTYPPKSESDYPFLGIVIFIIIFIIIGTVLIFIWKNWRMRKERY